MPPSALNHETTILKRLMLATNCIYPSPRPPPALFTAIAFCAHDIVNVKSTAKHVNAATAGHNNCQSSNIDVTAAQDDAT